MGDPPVSLRNNSLPPTKKEKKIYVIKKKIVIKKSNFEKYFKSENIFQISISNRDFKLGFEIAIQKF